MGADKPIRMVGLAGAWTFRGRPGESQAVFDACMVHPDCGARCSRYRYQLSRTWDASLPILTFVGLNPSTADHRQDDPTIRRVIGYAADWGCGGIKMMNVFALRSTDPKALYEAEEPTGDPSNLSMIELAFESARAAGGRLMLGWGSHGNWKARGFDIGKLALRVHGAPECFGRVGNGEPRHPLYLPKDLRPEPYA